MSAFEGISRFGIYGVGLLGGSFGLALQQAFPSVERVGIGRNEERLQQAVDCGAIDSFTTNPASLDHSLDALLLCTPVRSIHEHFAEAAAALKPHALVTDVGSTKADLVQRCESISEGQFRFVGSHPMAGSHKTGVTAATAGLFEGRLSIITPTPSTDPDARQWVIELWKALGMRIMLVSPEEHDRLTAFASHLPHLLASSLCHTVQPQGERIREVIGSGFLDTTRIAAGDPGLWLDICLDNRDAILEALNIFQRDIDTLRDAIQSEDQETIFGILQSAKTWKDSLS